MTAIDPPFRSVDPTTGAPVLRLPFDEPAKVESRLERCARAARSWGELEIRERAPYFDQLASVLERESESLAELATREMGKLLRASRAEIEKCARLCRHLASCAAGYLAPETVAADSGGIEVRPEPLGVILAITPWNFPYWQILRAAAPALAAGNTVLVKPAECVPATASALARLFELAGFPESAFELLFASRTEVGGVIEDARIAGVSLTGSEAAGRSVAARAGKSLKPTVLELGGSDPFLVFPSADLERAVDAAVEARIQNNGQSCIAAKRFLVHEAIYSEFERRLLERFATLAVGDPRDPSTDLGPLVHEEACARLESQVRASVQAGAELLLGGGRRPGPGAFFEPTILREPPRGCPAFEEELFGPVASLFRFRTLKEAVELAGAPGFGLGASLWTRDPQEATRAARELRAGTVAVNRLVVSDPRVPFGGVGRSGYGRELGRQGVLAFTRLKAVFGLSGSFSSG